MIYELNTLINGFGGIEETKKALEWFRLEVKNAGFKGLNLQVTLRGSSTHVTGVDGEPLGRQNEIIEELGFDGVSHYQFVHFTDIDRDFNEIIQDVEKEWNFLGEEFNVRYYPHVSVDWDNNLRFEMFRLGIMKNNTPENFEKALQEARAYVDAHHGQVPLITINSWNEWAETNYLQPYTMYGYLKAIKP